MRPPREVLAQARIRPKKRFGQNFLVDPATARAIARLSLRDAPPGMPMFEIGAGTGMLTQALLKEGAHLTAVEIDPQLVEVLRSRSDVTGATIIAGDALTFDYAGWSAGRNWRVVGNLPYNIATPLMLQFVEMAHGPERLTVMVQKDVAERLVAVPGTAAYGSLSVAVQYGMSVEMALNLDAQSFFPPPKVRSSVVVLTRRTAPAINTRDPEFFWKVVRGAFAYRRKTLANSLALSLTVDRARIARALADINLSPELRGERLDLSDFARLADALAEG